MATKIIEQWQCGECSELHDDKFEAQTCCRPQVFRAYVCSECEGQFPSEQECVNHIHCHRLQKGAASLGEWETAAKTEVVRADE